MKILIVEPSNTFQNIIDADFSVHGVAYQMVSTAAQAQDILSNQQFDLICMSLFLPDMYGLDFCKQLRHSATTRLTPILLLTAEENKDVYAQAFKLGVTEVFHKQDISDLLQYITYLSEQSNLYKKVHGNILYVEDIQSQADVVVSILQDAGLTVSHHLSAESAYKDFTESSYDLLITDVVLQGNMSGLGLVRMVRSTESEKGMIPVLALSGIEHSSRKIELLRSGVNDYVSKPFLPEELTTRVKNLVLAKQLVDESNKANSELSVRNQELKDTQEQLLDAQKLEALGVMAGGIAHEFNNTLAIISGNAEMLLDTAALETKKRAQVILQTTDKASKLVNQILMFSRIDGENIKPIDVTMVTLESLEMIRSVIPTKIEIQQNITGEHLHILGEATQVHQVIVNLCMNAYHAMEKTGGVILISLEKFNDSLQLIVSDTGCGISSENQHRIFDPFFTTKEVDKGTGLGLSVVYRIIENLQGNILVDSKLGIGTTFTITLPMTKEPLPLEPAAVEREEGAGHILIVEDEEDLALLYKEYLEAVGYETTLLNNGLSALSTFKQQPKRFDLVLTDNSMPKMTGEELAKELLAIRPNLPIILATGYNNIDDNKQAQANGIRQYLVKPIKLNLLTRAIADCLITEVKSN